METSPEPIIQIAAGFIAAKNLFVANEIGLFERLAERPASVVELSQRLGLPGRTLRIVVDALVVLGMIERDGDMYRSSTAAAAFLGGRTPADLRPFLRLWNRLSYSRWNAYEEVVRTDRALPAFTHDEQQLYSAGVEAITAGTAQALSGTYPFARHRRVLDVGGGTGSFLRALLERHANLECTLFELPTVAAVARERLGDNNVRIVPGDFFSDAMPAGHDAMLVANILHCFPASRNLELLRRLRAAAPAGGRLLLVDFWTDPSHTQPPFAALMAGEFLVTPGGGDVYSVDEGRAWLEDSGWSVAEHVPLGGPASLLVGEVIGCP
jgi:SAM-dependent methyltransferase